MTLVAGECAERGLTITITSTLFGIGICAGTLLLAISLASLIFPRLQFWPPPNKGSWQDYVFWILFRLMFLSLLAICVLDYNGLGQPPAWRMLIGLALLLVGFGMAFRVTAQLGWRDAHGEANHLNTTGWFAWSRNPIYVLSFVGMIGISLTINSAMVNWILVLWALMYVLAPFAEEPWLSKQFGEKYRQYKASVPRFIGRVKKDV